MLVNLTVTRFQRFSQFNCKAISLAAVVAMLAGGITFEVVSADDDPKTDSQQTLSPTKETATASTNEPKTLDAKTPPGDKSTEDKGESPLTTAVNAALKYRCNVVDKETGRGIPNARVKVRRSVRNSAGNRNIEETSHVTDTDGQFDLIIPPDQIATVDLYIELEVEHDDYVSRKGFGRSLVSIRSNEKKGDRPFFEKIELEPGEAITGTIVAPNGEPLPQIKVQVYSRVNRTDGASGSFNDSLTDAQGRFRISLHKDTNGVLWIIPKEFASIEKFLAKKRGDLGTIKLTKGFRVSGQVKSAEGKPLPGLAVRIEYSGRREVVGLPVATSVRRGAISDADGRFEFDPLAPGDYMVTPSESHGDPLIRDRTIYEVPGVFARQKVTIKEGIETQPILIQGIPYVLFSGQLYDSKGAKCGGNGNTVPVSGELDGTFWSAMGRPDNDGGFVVRVPHGLQRARISIIGTEYQAMRFRRGKDQPIQNTNAGGDELGAINDDVEGFEIIYYKAPVVKISAVDEEQKPVSDFRVAATYPWGKHLYVLKGELRSDLSFKQQADGRYRTIQMLPDEDVTFTVIAPGYESINKTVKLAESETHELVLTMKKETSENSKVGSELKN